MLVQYKWEAPELDKIWKGLYRENSYIFPYSSREYNENIFKYKKVKPTTLFQKDYFFVYYDNSDETTPLMIIPVYVKKKCVYIFGENISGAGNLDFIYSRYITDEQLFSAFKELGQYFKGMELKLYKINQRSRLYKFFENNYDTLLKLYDLKKWIVFVLKLFSLMNMSHIFKVYRGIQNLISTKPTTRLKRPMQKCIWM